jgi:hypothetical protein
MADEITNDDGVWQKKSDGSLVLITPSAGFETRRADPGKPARDAFIQRCKNLAAKAAAHATDGANPSLTSREINEAIAKLFKIAATL